MDTQIVTLTTEKLLLRSPTSLLDEAQFADFEMRNQRHWAPWESTPQSQLPYVQRLQKWEKECTEGQSARFFIFKKEQLDNMIGICNFTQIFRAPFHACYLGYKIDYEYEGRGLMYEALQRAIQYVFEDLHLHRIMANYMPNNTRSAKLLDRLGFVIEGYAREYLLINHQWEDHVLTALTNRNWLESEPIIQLEGKK
jgi:[ribosomal protein S5]-alanine N-acetyltransferase